MLEKLKPARLWYHFEELTRIPRCSKNEKRAAQYVISVAKTNGLTWKQDSAGNVIVSKPSSRGHEKAPVTILQGHLDMVCEKNTEVAHDFTKDPLKPRIVGDYVKATGTTLGADNGLGVAAALVLMESKEVVHGPLEFLFTVDEETGLTGASLLEGRMLKGRTMINLDTEEDGALYVGCAGGMDTVIKLRVGREKSKPKGFLYAKLSITGLRGGHSGVDIHEQRGNANQLLSRMLLDLHIRFGIRLISASGGSKRNAIPREAFALIAIPASQYLNAENLMKEYGKIFKSELKGVDENVRVGVEKTDQVPYPPLITGSTSKALNMLNSLPHGVIAMSLEIPGLVETSTNLAIITTTKGQLQIDTSQRSSVESQKIAIVRKMASLGQLAGAHVIHNSGYPGWKPNMDSPVLKTCVQVYKKMFKKEPKVKAIHAGLECGIIGERIKGMDMVSLGPQIENAHSPDEQAHIPSVEKFWKYLLEILRTLA